MRRFAVLLYLFSLAFAVTARAEDWTTADGKTYRNVVVVGQESDGVRITYTGGVGKIPYYELSDDLLKRFGQDPATLAAKRQAAREAAAAAALQAQQDAAAAAAAAQNAPQQPNSTPSNSSSTSTPGPASTNATPGPASTSTANSNPAPHPAPTPAPAPAPENQAPPPSSGVAASAAVPTEENPYPHSRYQYNDNLDESYLDSFTINVQPVLLDTTATSAAAAAPGATLFLRIETEGHKAEAPDSVAGMFVSSVPLKKLEKDRSVKFLVDGSFIQASPVQVDNDDAPPDPAQLLLQVSFSLTPEQMRSIILGKRVNFNVGGYDYRIDDAGMLTLRGYLDDVDHLPPPSTSIVKSYHRFLNRLPSIITMISTTCEYIILGAFAIVVLASIAAFAMGLTRFIKM